MLQISLAFERSFEPVSFHSVSLAPSAEPTPLQTHNSTGNFTKGPLFQLTLQICVASCIHGQQQNQVQLTAGPLVLYSTDPRFHRIEGFLALTFHFFLATTFALEHLIRQMAGTNHNGHILKIYFF